MSSILTNNTIGISIHNNKKDMHETIQTQKKNREKKRKKKEERNNGEKKEKKKKYYNKRKKVRSLYTCISSKNNISPHPLLLIGSKIIDKIRENCIFLSDMTRTNKKPNMNSDGGITSFVITYVGKNVTSFMKNNMNTSNTIDEDYGDKNFLAILAKTADSNLQNDRHIHFVTTNSTDDDTYEHVLLLLYISNIQKHFKNKPANTPLEYTSTWDNHNDFIHLKKIKQSTIKNNNPEHHYGSQGYCFSFGLRNDFKKIKDDLISVGLYAGDDHESSAKYIQFIGRHLHKCFNSFDSIISSMSSYINFTCKSFKCEAKKTNINKYVSTFNNNFNQSKSQSVTTANININATTRDIHCEKDTTYTTIIVPEQKDDKARIVFQFKINSETTVQLDVKPNGAFTYSGYCLAHRQLQTFGENCMNISTYSAKSVFSNFRQSLLRIKKLEK